MPRIVAHEHLPAAASLNSLRWTVGGVAGPALAGVVVAYAGLGWAYAVDLVTFAVSVLFVVGLAASPASHEAAKPSLRSIAEGARYAWSRKELLGTYAIDLAAMFLAMPLAVLPFLADELDAEWSLGLMYAAIPAGSLLVSLTSGWTSRVHRHGRMVVLGAAGWGLAIAASGLVGNVWLVLLFLLLGGCFDMVSGIFRARDVEPDDPGRAARTPRRHRAALLLRRARSSARSEPVAWPRGAACGRRCGRAASRAWPRWACWPCACRA